MPHNSSARADVACHLHPFTDLSAHEAHGPQIFTEGRGIYLLDDRGGTFMDGMSGLWCCTLGYDEDRLIEAAYAQLKELPYCHTFRGRSHPKVIELSERLLQVAPDPMSKAFFANSGSEANDTAVRLAWQYHHARGKPRKKIVSRYGSYHGSTIMTASLSGHAYMHVDSHLPLDGVVFADCPHFSRYRRDGESESSFVDRMIENLEALIKREGPHTIAAFIAEPVMGVGGVILPPDDYWPRVCEVLRKHDILLIADEVICGFGRTGEMFGSVRFGLEPDIMTCAKGLSSAYFPISAVLVSDRVYRALVQLSARHGLFAHGLTYSGHPVGAAVALSALEVYQERDLCSHVRQVGQVLQSELACFEESPPVREVRGVGLMAAVEFESDEAEQDGYAKGPGRGLAQQIVDRAQSLGLLLRAVGESVIIAPPLIVSADEVRDLVARFGQAVAAREAGSRT